MQFKFAIQEPIDQKASLLLVSAPEHVLLKAKALVEKRGGYCAAFTQFDSRSPKTMSVGQFLKRLLKNASFAKTWDLLSDMFVSWTLKGKWKLVWGGRVTQGLDMLKQMDPQRIVIAIAIKGGRHCEWEQQQFAPSGELRNLYPNVPLLIFEDFEHLVQAMTDSKVELVKAACSENCRM